MLGAPAISSILEKGILTFVLPLLFVALLGAGQHLFGSHWPAGVFLLVCMIFIFRPSGPVDFAFDIILASSFLAVLVRAGLVAMMVAVLTRELGVISAAVDWSAWYARQTILSIILLSALAAYGVWAATEGRTWSEAES